MKITKKVLLSLGFTEMDENTFSLSISTKAVLGAIIVSKCGLAKHYHVYSAGHPEQFCRVIIVSHLMQVVVTLSMRFGQISLRDELNLVVDRGLDP